jgi:hypothetical protein
MTIPRRFLNPNLRPSLLPCQWTQRREHDGSLPALDSRLVHSWLADLFDNVRAIDVL